MRPVPGGPDQVPRLLRFREQHPDVTITLDGFWRAVIPAENGETVICRYELGALLDKLAEVLGAASLRRVLGPYLPVS